MSGERLYTARPRWPGMDIGEGCGVAHHLLAIVHTRRMRDLFKKLYWIRCWRCGFRSGPWDSAPIARANWAHLDRLGREARRRDASGEEGER